VNIVKDLIMNRKVVLKHHRMYYDDTHTMGYILFDGKINYILEDTKRSNKIAGETRINAGLYEIKQKKILTPLTKSYRKRYNWFEWHLELQNVKNFNNIYDHIGNFAKDTRGCRLHGLYPSNPRIESVNMVKNSTAAFKDYYKYVNELLESGIRVFTKIIDEVK
jgi:hypothetical protein